MSTDAAKNWQAIPGHRAWRWKPRVWWGGRFYRARMRLLHRFDLCWMQPLPMRDGDYGQWINVWCHWCGVRGRRLDMDRVPSPTRPEESR